MIPLTSNQFVVVDAKHYKALSLINWRYSSGYARNHVFGYMHRFILNADNDEEIDHVDRDKLNCMESNIRLADRSLNAFNQSERKTNTSGKKGVWWSSRNKNWRAEIMKDYKKICLGAFKNKTDAIEARIKAEKIYYGN